MVELNVQLDHVHLIVMVPPKIAVSNYVGTVKSRTAIRVFNKFKALKQRPYWGNHFWPKGFCSDAIGLDAEKIRLYILHQNKKERESEQQGIFIPF